MVIDQSSQSIVSAQADAIASAKTASAAKRARPKALGLLHRTGCPGLLRLGHVCKFAQTSASQGLRAAAPDWVSHENWSGVRDRSVVFASSARRARRRFAMPGMGRRRDRAAECCRCLRHGRASRPRMLLRYSSRQRLSRAAPGIARPVRGRGLPNNRSVGRRGHVPYRGRNVVGVRRKIQSGAADRQCQYRSRAEDQSSHRSLPCSASSRPWRGNMRRGSARRADATRSSQTRNSPITSWTTSSPRSTTTTPPGRSSARIAPLLP